MEKQVKAKKLPGRVPVAKAAGQKALTEPSGSDRPTYTGGATNTSHASAPDDQGTKTGLKMRLLFDTEKTARVASKEKGTSDMDNMDCAKRGEKKGTKTQTRKTEVDSDDTATIRSRSPGRDKDGRKRPRPGRGSDASRSNCTSSDEDQPATKMLAKKTTGAPRGRGRPPTTGEYVGLAKAKADLLMIEREAMELEVEKELAEDARRVYQLRTRLSEASADEEPSASDLREIVHEHVGLINRVALKSSNLKGTYVRTLREAATAISEAVKILSKSSVSAETKKLAADNSRLKVEVEALRSELAALRSDLQRSQTKKPDVTKTPPPTSAPIEPELLQRSIIEAVGNMMNARFEALEDRLLPERRLRPPLASDEANAQGLGRPSTPTPIPRAAPRVARAACTLTLDRDDADELNTQPEMTYRAALKTAPKSAPKRTKESPAPQAPGESVIPSGVKKGKKRKKTRQAVTTDPVQAERQGQPSREEHAEWTIVSRRKSKPASKPASRPAKPKKKKVAKLRPPATSAVVLKLQPDAESRGVTYAGILTEAKKKVDLAALGIEALGFRRAVTGARILVLPGAQSGDKADSLAAKLQEVLEETDVHISRPEKCADLRILGLDDTVEKSDVVKAVAATGGCTEAAVKTGDIRRGRGLSGLGTIIVSCPVGAAKKIVGADRFFVGWSSVKVALLQARPLRCFKCQELGHVKGLCTAEEDRSSACFRCGQLGHKSAQCSAAPHCLVCAASQKPSNHRLGSKSCAAAKPEAKRRRQGAARPSDRQQPVCPAATVSGEVEMEAT